jgi:hypothetical protein
MLLQIKTSREVAAALSCPKFTDLRLTTLTTEPEQDENMDVVLLFLFLQNNIFLFNYF